jgi:hypothetical protein
MGRLAQLRDADVLTEEEFQRERVKVVEGWTPPQMHSQRPSDDDNGRAAASQLPPGRPPAP